MRLFIPSLELTGLKFSHVEDSTPLDWYTNTLVSSESGGTTIDVSDEQIFVFRVRPCAISEDNGHYSKDWDYQRWCLRLVQGEYRVWYDLEVGEDYFNADSHLRFNDIEQMARKANAHLWCGSAKSNNLAVYHVER